MRSPAHNCEFGSELVMPLSVRACAQLEISTTGTTELIIYRGKTSMSDRAALK
jgi:hypothetical protein